MHVEFAITCDVCYCQHDDADFYPDQAKQRARADGHPRGVHRGVV